MDVKEINAERSKSNYQVFKFKDDGTMYGLVGRIPNKLKAYGGLFPKDFTNKSLLDVGCDFGFWCFEAAARGAYKTTGLDRGRDERDGTHYEICDMNRRVRDQFPDKYSQCGFYEVNLSFKDGQEHNNYGQHDIVMCCSMYHHIYAQCGQHDVIFKWLSEHVKDGGYMIWENPVDLTDGVANKHIPQKFKGDFTKDKILEAANKYFDVEYVGNAMHVNTRQVYKMVKNDL